MWEREETKYKHTHTLIVGGVCSAAAAAAVVDFDDDDDAGGNMANGFNRLDEEHNNSMAEVRRALYLESRLDDGPLPLACVWRWATHICLTTVATNWKVGRIISVAITESVYYSCCFCCCMFFKCCYNFLKFVLALKLVPPN